MATECVVPLLLLTKVIKEPYRGPYPKVIRLSRGLYSRNGLANNAITCANTKACRDV